MIGAVAAQNSAPHGDSSDNPPAATQTSAPKADKIAPTSGGSAHFISVQTPDQWLVSKLKGTDVIGADNKSIGNLADILLDKSGKIEAYIVSVGGFFGIGAKDVALAPQSFAVVAGDKTKGESDKLKVTMNVDDLKQAASFERYYPPRVTTSSGGSNGTPLRLHMSPSRSGS